MTTTVTSTRPIRFASFCVSTALAAGLLAGCGSTAAHPGKFARNAEQALQGGQVDKAVTLAEQAVAADGRNAGYRLLLGNTYLRAGRFDSARAAYDDAMELGEDGGKAALSLALAQIALGRGNEAVDTLNTYSDSIPARDLGLALALAGQTGRGAKMLTDVLRGGENTPKVRQNLALAYALDGSWREASIMAAQDVPADKVEDRLKSWAALAGPEQAHLRVATLLGTPVRSDPGQPAALALANYPAPGQAQGPASAAAAPAPADPASADQAKAAALAKAALRELPAIDGTPAPAPALADASSVAPRTQLAVIDLPAAQTDAAPLRPAAQGSGVAMVAGRMGGVAMIAGRMGLQASTSASTPASTATSTPASAPAARAPVIKASAVRANAAVASGAAPVAAPVERSTHVAQLGAFATPGGARRAWRHFVARDPGLAGYRSVITRATVHGREFWRVQAAGFVGFASAQTLCGSVKARGGACLVMAAAHVPAPAPAVLTPAPARLARNR